MNGDSVKLVTGTDEHGMKIQRAAAKQNIPVQQYCDSVASKYNVSNAFQIQVFEKVKRQLLSIVHCSHNCKTFSNVIYPAAIVDLLHNSPLIACPCFMVNQSLSTTSRLLISIFCNNA